MINCMSIKNDTTFPFTGNLVKVQQLLKERLGRDVFIYSITVDPENDTPRALNEFARKYQVGEGWLFLTGERSVIELLRSRLFVSPGSSGHDHHNDRRGLFIGTHPLWKRGSRSVGSCSGKVGRGVNRCPVIVDQIRAAAERNIYARRSSAFGGSLTKFQEDI